MKRIATRPKSNRRWVSETFSVDRITEKPYFDRVAREAERSSPRVTKSAYLVQIVKDHFFVKDQIAKSQRPSKEFKAPR